MNTSRPGAAPAGPRRPGSRPAPQHRSRPSFGTMFWRGARRRCPLCGSRRSIFSGYFARRDRCSVCGFRVERGLDGFMTGAMAVNVILTFLLLGFVMLGFFIATFPSPPVLPLVALLLVLAVVVPVLLSPSAYTMWLAVDLLMRAPEPAELDDALLQGSDPHALDEFRPKA